jgi:hypothetical protein
MLTDEEYVAKVEKVHDALSKKFTKELFKAIRKLSEKDGVQFLPGVYTSDVDWHVIVATGLPTNPKTTGKEYAVKLHLEIDPFKKEKHKSS